MSQKRLVKDLASFTGSSVAVQALGVFTAIFIRKVLGPEAMGIWALLQVLQGYISYTNLGMTNAVSRELPVLKGAGAGEERLRTIRDAGYAYVSLMSFLAAAGLAAYAFLNVRVLSPELFWGFLTLGALSLIERRNNYTLQVLYAEKRFTFAARFRLYSSLVNTALVWTLVWKWHLYGFFAANLLSFFFNAAYLGAKSDTRFRFRADRGTVRFLLGVGAPIFVYGTASAFFNSLDKVAIGKFLGLHELGLYSLAMMAAGYAFLLPNMTQVVLLPWTLERFGDPNAHEARRNFALLPGRLMSVYFTLLIGLAWITAPYLCARVLPEYIEGVGALKAALYGAAFMALQQQMYHICLGYKRHVYLLPVVGVLTIGFLGGAWAAARFHEWGITQLAVLMAVFQGVYYLSTSALAIEKELGLGRFASEMARNLSLFAVTAAVLTALDAIGRSESLTATAVKGLAFAAFWTAVLFVFERQLGAISLAKQAWSAWRAKKTVAGAVS